MSDKSRKKPPSKEVLAWLGKQASKLTQLVTRGWKIQAEYLQNAKEKGEILVEIRSRLEGTSLTFEQWVRDNTEIGVSTAYLWMDVAEWWDDVKAYIDKPRDGVVSNPLETSLRGIRDTIRSIRQARGLGKPGSGKKKVNADDACHHVTKPPANETGDDNPLPPDGVTADRSDVSDQEEGVEGEDQEARTTPASDVGEANYTKLMDRFKPGGDMHESGTTSKATRPRSYKVTVVTPAKADLAKFASLLPSPITDFNAHSVFAWVSLQEIDKTLATVCNALSTALPKKVRIIVEL